MIFPSRRRLHESRHQVYRHGRAQGSDCNRRPQWQWQAGHGVRLAILPRMAESTTPARCGSGVTEPFSLAPARQLCRPPRSYWIELATEEKALLAFEPTSRMVPTTSTRMTASITAYSAISCPLSSIRSLRNDAIMLHLPAFPSAENN